jgi:hypothetical protein
MAHLFGFGARDLARFREQDIIIFKIIDILLNLEYIFIFLCFLFALVRWVVLCLLVYGQWLRAAWLQVLVAVVFR